MIESGALGAVLFMGRPGSGKGTQAKLLSEHLGWTMFSTGGHFKELIEAHGHLSERIRQDYDRGQLSPNWLAAYFFEQAILDLAPDKGIVTEGFARSLPQAKLVDDIFTWLGRPYRVVYLEVSEAEGLARQLSRAHVEHRPDSDTEDKVHARSEVFRANTEPAIDFFRKNGALIEINGEQSVEAIEQDVRKALSV
jgi:adenylate kinase